MDLQHIQSTDLEPTLSEEALNHYNHILHQSDLMRNVEDVIASIAKDLLDKYYKSSGIGLHTDYRVSLRINRYGASHRVIWCLGKEGDFIPAEIGSFNLTSGILTVEYLELENFWKNVESRPFFSAVSHKTSKISDFVKNVLPADSSLRTTLEAEDQYAENVKKLNKQAEGVINSFINLYNSLFEGEFNDAFAEKFGRQPVTASILSKE